MELPPRDPAEIPAPPSPAERTRHLFRRLTRSSGGD
ncbi:hypothetical protein J2S43_006416 [Catenuloplanes nepalensis]|uniref:Uncharacterized protein n=1 Tax=Catenuloplanes nepalensis TaxID=587533 RepID=A0ABT9N2H6_9ACTN|nr:hypothetical protein [Catenuloplanes nepalensis]